MHRRSLPKRERKATVTHAITKNKKAYVKQSKATPVSKVLKQKKSVKATSRMSSKNAEQLYEVDRILGVKRSGNGDVIGYKVSWKGYGKSHDSFVAVADATGCDRLIREFYARTS